MNSDRVKEALEDMEPKALAELAAPYLCSDDEEYYHDFDEICDVQGWTPYEIWWQSNGEDIRNTDVYTINGEGNLECRTWEELAEQALDTFESWVAEIAWKNLPWDLRDALDDDGDEDD
jgi:hypothetical protein